MLRRPEELSPPPSRPCCSESRPRLRLRQRAARAAPPLPVRQGPSLARQGISAPVASSVTPASHSRRCLCVAQSLRGTNALASCLLVHFTVAPDYGQEGSATAVAA